jgi:hypothetical protein
MVTGTTNEFEACVELTVIEPVYVPGASPAGLNDTVTVSGAVHVTEVDPFTVSQFVPPWLPATAVPNMGLPESSLIVSPVDAGGCP